MQPPDIPQDENLRLASLHALQILDTPAEKGFEHLAQLARELFDMPMALVSLVDTDRQWFKAHQGLGIRQTHRDIAFCAHAVASNDILVIGDTHQDSRFADNPLVSESPYIRFYAGYPLRPLDDQPVGTLCLLDTRPRGLDAHQQRLLKGLAGQAEELLRQHQLRQRFAQATLRYKALFNGSATGIVRIDRAGIIRAINPFALKMLGYEHEDVLGKNVAILAPPDVASTHDGYLQRYLAGGTPRIIGRGRDIEALHKHGHRVPAHLAVNAIHDNDGQVSEFIGVLTDLSHLHLANQRIQQEQILLKVLHQGITDYQALMSGEKLWDFLMEALRELTDSQYSLIGEVLTTAKTPTLKIHAITDVSLIDDSTLLTPQPRNGKMILSDPDSLLGRVFTQGRVVANEAVDKHGNPLRFHPGHAPLSNYLGVPIYSEGRVIGMFAIANSSKPLDQALIEWLQPFTDTCALLLNLYRQMAEREMVTSALAKARDQAEKANQAKSEFLSSMSHELRTPLNAILGFAQLLTNSKRYPLNPKQQRQVQQIEKSGRHLLALINEVLDLAKIEAGHLALSLEPINLASVFEDACTTLDGTAEAAGIRLYRHLPSPQLHVEADYTRTKQILLNLISNAIKYNREQGEVRVTYHPEKRQIRVTDTGPGIPLERHPELFEPFNRLDAEHGKVEGTGIGLAITRQLVERMGGDLGVESTLGEGSTFWFTLPKVTALPLKSNEDSEAETSQATQQAHAFDRRQILYIEDNPANQRLMEDIFEDLETLSLCTVPSAEIGLDLIRAQPPALVIMDIHLPGMDGYQALAQIRRDATLRPLHVIALSANAMPSDIKRGLEAGFDAYLTKPIDIVALLKTLSSLLNTPLETVFDTEQLKRSDGPGKDA
ncbi:ATP-binding protein [Vreelandella rituensis]|uniref:histidine kinase n=1 Tax=Vreelandella rituensis TaxID=2282306 RepID=A0A368U7N8_9GAMM|nr:ATP-binding protein [Halomonas rituensis]RCV93189.1 response regulator [Halomonas rituensis]